MCILYILPHNTANAQSVRQFARRITSQTGQKGKMKAQEGGKASQHVIWLAFN